MATVTSTYVSYTVEQAGLSSGVTQTLFGGAVWKRARLQPFNIGGNPEAPRPSECQIWPRGVAQTGDPSA